MHGLNVDFAITDEIHEVERLLKTVELWSEHIMCTDWKDIDESGVSNETNLKYKNLASKRNYERLLVIEKLREKLLCE